MGLPHWLHYFSTFIKVHKGLFYAIGSLELPHISPNVFPQPVQFVDSEDDVLAGRNLQFYCLALHQSWTNKLVSSSKAPISSANTLFVFLVTLCQEIKCKFGERQHYKSG